MVNIPDSAVVVDEAMGKIIPFSNTFVHESTVQMGKRLKLLKEGPIYNGFGIEHRDHTKQLNALVAEHEFLQFPHWTQSTRIQAMALFANVQLTKEEKARLGVLRTLMNQFGDSMLLNSPNIKRTIASIAEVSKGQLVENPADLKTRCLVRVMTTVAQSALDRLKVMPNQPFLFVPDDIVDEEQKDEYLAAIQDVLRAMPVFVDALTKKLDIQNELPAAAPSMVLGQLIVDSLYSLGVSVQSKSAKKVENPFARPAYRKDTPKVGRNQQCPCMSGVKFKHCCMKKHADGTDATMN